MVEDKKVKSTDAEIALADAETTEFSKGEFNLLKDEALANQLFIRGLDVPLDENGRVMRKVAIQRIINWEDESKPLSAYRKMRVIFHRTGREEENSYVFLSLNGIAYQVPYEKEVSLPEPVIRSCCDNAVMTTNDYKGIDLENGKAIYAERDVHTVPYSFLGYVEAVK